MLSRIALLLVALIVISTGAHAHTDASIHSGFLHPISGMDHFFVMVGVGIWASSIGGQAMWKLPLGFMTMMVFGGILGIGTVDVPFIELTILASIVVITGLWMFRIKMSDWAGTAVAGFFAIAHGYAHSVEMPADVSPVSYSVGFIVMTGLLQALGLYLGYSQDNRIVGSKH